MKSMSCREFDQLASLVKSRVGINLKREKEYLIVGRLQSLLTEKGLHSYGDYYDYLLKDCSGQAITELVNRITTNHTYFMREKEHFEFLKEQGLPQLTLKYGAKGERDLRVWSAGCSSGEEAYCLAMLVQEHLGNDSGEWDARILATDISSRVLDAAQKGIYKEEQLSALPARWKKLYFQRVDADRYTVNERIKQEVIFRRFNLVNRPFPFKKKFHVIFCRNVMIYFDAPTKQTLVERFCSIIDSGGYLFVGQSESLGKHPPGLQYVRPSVYRKE